MSGRDLIFAALRSVFWYKSRWLYHSSRYQFFGNDGVIGESKTLFAGFLLMHKCQLPLHVVIFEFRALLSIKLSASKRFSILGVSQKCSQGWSSLSIESSKSERGQFIPLLPRFSSMSRTCFFSSWLDICLSVTIFLFSRSYEKTNDLYRK